MSRAIALPPQAKPTMRRALSDPALLGNVLAGDSWRAWRILLIAAMGEALDDAERAIFTKLTGRASEPLQRVDELWGIVGRRGGKSRAIAVLVTFIAIFVDHSAVLVAGERPVVICLAPSQKQASIVLNYVEAVIISAPMLAKMLTNRTANVLSLSNGIEIEVRSASFRNVRGVTAVAVIADEAAYFYAEESGSTNPDTAILDAIRPSLATTGGIMAVISSPYARRGEVFDTWSRHYGEKGDPLILVFQGASRDLNPSLPQKVVDRAMAADLASASAEYLGQFRSDIEAFINREAVEAVTMLDRFELPPLSDRSYVAFVDPSGGSADSFTLAIAHVEGDSAILDAVREVRPPFSPASVVEEFAALIRSYNIMSVSGDRYAGEWPRERFREAGIGYQPSEQTKNEIYRDILPMINSGSVELLDIARLSNQFCGLERRTARGGRDSVDHGPGQHDDVANACAGALVLAKSGGSFVATFIKAWG